MPTTKPNHRLKSARELRGWSQAYLAKQIGAQNYYLSRWERGEMTPSPYYQQQLCELFGKTAEELGFLTPEENEATPPASVADLPTNIPSESPSPEPSLSQSPSLTPPPFKPSTPETYPTAPVQPFWKRHVRLLLVASALLLLLGGAGSLVAIRLMQAPMTAAGGTFSFASSGIISTNSSQGMADEIQIEMTLDRPPATGMQYYAWLIPDEDKPEDNNRLLVGPLILHGTTGTLSYSDPAHTNLLLAHGGLEITEQPTSPTPRFYIPKDVRYQAIIPQTPGPDSKRLLDHLRHLLASDPTLEEKYHTYGGLTAWMVNNIQQIATWATDAQTALQQNQAEAFHQDLLCILDYLDGLNTIGQDPNLSGPERLAKTLTQEQLQEGQIGLLDIPGSQPTNPEAYIPHIQLHLNGVTSSPGVTDQQQETANQIMATTYTLSDSLFSARQDTYMLLNQPSQTQQQFPDLIASITNANKEAQQAATQMPQLLHFSITTVP